MHHPLGKTPPYLQKLSLRDVERYGVQKIVVVVVGGWNTAMCGFKTDTSAANWRCISLSNCAKTFFIFYPLLFLCRAEIRRFLLRAASALE